MIINVYTVWDNKVEAYLQPFFSPTKGSAIRAFSEVVNDRSHVFGKNPADYVLFELGSFDDSKGSFNLHAAPVSIGVAVEFVRSVT